MFVAIVEAAMAYQGSDLPLMKYSSMLESAALTLVRAATNMTMAK